MIAYAATRLNICADFSTTRSFDLKIHLFSRHSVVALVLWAVLSGAAWPSALSKAKQGSDFISFGDVLDRAPKGAVECADHDVHSDTCAAVGSYQRVGAKRVIFIGRALFNEEPMMEGIMSFSLDIQDGVACTNFGDLDLEIFSDDPAFDAANLEKFTALMTNTLKKIGFICSAYFAAGDGYVTKTYDGDGTEMVDFEGTSIFVTREIELRVGD